MKFYSLYPWQLIVLIIAMVVIDSARAISAEELLSVPFAQVKGSAHDNNNMTTAVLIFDVGTTEKSVLVNRIHRFFLAEHLEAYSALSTKQSPRRWIGDMLKLAELWAWKTPDALQLLLEESLYARGHVPSQEWYPLPGELPQAHFNRVFEMSLLQ
ncbi:hypothetical protein C1X64_27520 [Pseudomonas sp. GW456-E7]|nr:hypothetical protein C1X64_27520 [Pseudomonas sp. GW456-E7]